MHDRLAFSVADVELAAETSASSGTSQQYCWAVYSWCRRITDEYNALHNDVQR